MDPEIKDVNELIKRRYEELNELKEKGFLPYAYSFDVDTYSEDIKKNFKEDEKRNVKVAGRIMALRRMGKASFAHVLDDKGRIQIYLRKDEIGEEYNAFINRSSKRVQFVLENIADTGFEVREAALHYEIEANR